MSKILNRLTEIHKGNPNVPLETKIIAWGLLAYGYGMIILVATSIVLIYF